MQQLVCSCANRAEALCEPACSCHITLVVQLVSYSLCRFKKLSTGTDLQIWSIPVVNHPSDGNSSCNSCSVAALQAEPHPHSDVRLLTACACVHMQACSICKPRNHALIHASAVVSKNRLSSRVQNHSLPQHHTRPCPWATAAPAHVGKHMCVILIKLIIKP